MRWIDKVMGAVIFVLCLPLFIFVIPLICARDWLMQLRGVRLGQEVTHFPMRDVREDYVVADLSRLDEGLVGIRRRRWKLRSGRGSRRGPPPYRPEIKFIRRGRFWVPRSLSFRSQADE